MRNSVFGDYELGNLVFCNYGQKTDLQEGFHRPVTESLSSVVRLSSNYPLPATHYVQPSTCYPLPTT